MLWIDTAEALIISKEKWEKVYSIGLELVLLY